MDAIRTEQEQLNQFELLGLKKENPKGLSFYSLNFTDKQPSAQSISQLKKLLKTHRVAVEMGPGNQVDSLLFASQKAEADVVIGIDPYFDFTKIEGPKSSLAGQVSPTIILLRGDGWGDRRINELFGAYGNNRDDRLAVYAQLVSPDTQATERMIDATVSKTRGGCLIVLDSGAVDALEKGVVPLDVTPSKIKEGLLKQRGVENPTLLDWIVNVSMRGTKMKRMTEGEYQTGVDGGNYPPTSFLRKGEMVVWDKPVPELK